MYVCMYVYDYVHVPVWGYFVRVFMYEITQNRQASIASRTADYLPRMWREFCSSRLNPTN